MRIRRRQQGQFLSSLLPSDPPTQHPLPNASPRDHHLELHPGEKKQELHPDAATTADLTDEPSSAARRAALLPLLPQGNVVECSRGLVGAQREPAADDGHRSLENGHHHMPEPVISRAEERLANGTDSAMPVTVVAAARVQKEEIIKDDGGGGIKKRRGPAVLQEGSRCSRVNGRGWRCSQPTLVGYSLCEHHLGKGRMRSAAAARRTEHRKSVPAVVVAAVTPPPKADAPPPSVPHC